MSGIAYTSQRQAPANWPKLRLAAEEILAALDQLAAMTEAQRADAHAPDQRIAAAVRVIVRLCAGG